MKVYSVESAGEARDGSLVNDDVNRLIHIKRKWLRKEDKQRLCEKHGMTLSTLNRQLAGKVQQFNVAMITDALDVANKTEAQIRVRI